MNNFYIKSVSSLFQQKILWSHLKVNSWPGARLHHPCSPPLLSLCQRHLQPPGSKYQNINFTQTKAFKSLRLSKIEILKWKHWYWNILDWQSSNTKCLTYNIGICWKTDKGWNVKVTLCSGQPARPETIEYQYFGTR